MHPTPLDTVAPTACVCYAPEEGGGCVCPDAERALRAYSAHHPLPAMTPEQRAWCLDELARVEGYDRQDYEACDDATLARGVLYAWVDFCRDKGLL